jgi:hypothetical protein
LSHLASESVDSTDEITKRDNVVEGQQPSRLRSADPVRHHGQGPTDFAGVAGHSALEDPSGGVVTQLTARAG